MALAKLRALARNLIPPPWRKPAPASPTPDTGQILLERKEGVVTVKLYNPGKLNALSVRMWDTLRSTFRSLSADPSIRCIVLRGADGNFAAGADIAQFPAMRATLEQVRKYHLETIALALRAVDECPHPTVACIEGVCVGGGLEIASQCDLRIAAADSRFAVPINRLGFPMAPDELRRLLALCGRAVALEILLEGRVFGAAEAKEKGLLTRVVPPEKVVDEAYAVAARIVAGAPIAQRLNKRLIHRLAPEPPRLNEAELDEIFAAFAESHDHREGVAAFLEKRPPQFRGE